MKMTTFVEAYDGDSDEDEVVIVPYVKPTPPLITLAESESDDSTCSDHSPSSSPRPKRRKVHSRIFGRGSGSTSDNLAQQSADATSVSNLPVVPTSANDVTAKSSQRKVKENNSANKTKANEEDEDWDAPQPTVGKSWTKSPCQSSALPSRGNSSAKRQSETSRTPSTPVKSITKESTEEFIRFAASLGLPVLTPESQAELLKNGPPELAAAENDYTSAGPVDWADIDKDEDDDDDDCIILDDDEEEEPPPVSTLTIEEIVEPEDNDPTETIQLNAEVRVPEPELEVIEPPTPKRDPCIFPPTWTPEMQHFYGDKRPNFSTTKIYRKQSDEPRLWRIFEDGHRHRKKNFYLQCNNCQQRGHRFRDCPEEIKGLICWMCGEHGDHHVERCPKRMCLSCGRQTNRFQFPCNKCGPPNEGFRNSILLGKCAICDMEGHLDGRCPDLWRRFHSTTLSQVERDANVSISSGSRPTKATDSWKVQNNGKGEYLRKSKSSCANCGMKGHNYFQCKGSRQHSFINTPFIIHELGDDELKKIGEMCSTETNSNDDNHGNRNEEATTTDAVTQDGHSGQSQSLPNFNPKSERIVSLDTTDHELLRDAYEQKVPAALLFFSSHIQNIIKVVPREKTIDIHLNGASSTKVRNAKRNLFRTLAKLRVEKGLVEMERASTDDLLPPPSTLYPDKVEFMLDTSGNRSWEEASLDLPAAGVRIGYLDTHKEKSQDLYLKTMIGQMVPNPLYKEKGKHMSDREPESQPTEPAVESAKEKPKHSESADADNTAWRAESDADTTDEEFAGAEAKKQKQERKGINTPPAPRKIIFVDVRNSKNNNRVQGQGQGRFGQSQTHPRPRSAAERIKMRKERQLERAQRQHDPHHSREFYQRRRNQNQKREQDAGWGRIQQQQQPPQPARAPRYFD